MEGPSGANPVPSARRSIMHGMRWVFASSVFGQIARLAVAIVLARLLTPDEYGVAALVLVFASLVLVFSDLALGAAIIQRSELSEADRSTAFWTSIGAGTVFTIAGVLLAAPIAALFSQPSVAPLCVALSLSFIVTSAAVVQEALLIREMQFKSLEVRMMVSTTVSGLIALVVAAMGGGAWAIIVQQVTGAVISTVLIWRFSSWRPRWTFSRESLHSLGTFSGYLVGHRLLFYVHRNADNFLIGRFVGTAALGAYAVAYNVMLAPMSRLAGPLQRVFAPTFSRMQDEPERIAAGWLRATRLLGTVAIPSMAGLVIVAPDFVPVVLGEQWRPAVVLIQVLAWVGLLQALQTLNMDVLQARGRARTIFRYSIGFTAAHIAAFVVGLHWGVVGVAVAYSISSTLVEPCLTVLTARCVGISPWAFVTNLSRVVQATAGMAGVVLVTRWLLVDAEVAPVLRLLACIVAGVLSFLPLCLWRVPGLYGEVRGLLGDFFAPRRQSAPVGA
jgi:O-antigen/teichoic acid export membrane protein